jgi:hypothetical protein
MHTAFKLKIFGNDAFGKVSTRCKVGSSVINNMLEKNTVFSPSSSVQARLPFHACPLNEETFKSVVVELLKCSNDTNVQRHYVGDGEGHVELAGFSIPPAALTDGNKPGAEMLFKLNLHEVKGLFESQLYLKNPNATDLATARIQAAVLDAIGCVANGQPAHQSTFGYSTISTSQLTSAESSISNNNDDLLNNNTPDDNNKDADKKKKVSPAAAMAEASLLSQKAAILEQDKNRKMSSQSLTYPNSFRLSLSRRKVGKPRGTSCT